MLNDETPTQDLEDFYVIIQKKMVERKKKRQALRLINIMKSDNSPQSALEEFMKLPEDEPISDDVLHEKFNGDKGKYCRYYGELLESERPIKIIPAKEFYKSRGWLELRFDFLKNKERICVLCGSTKEIHVDHIKPRSKYPELQLNGDNLQLLCKKCNLGKSNRDETRFG